MPCLCNGSEPLWRGKGAIPTGHLGALVGQLTTTTGKCSPSPTQVALEPVKPVLTGAMHSQLNHTPECPGPPERRSDSCSETPDKLKAAKKKRRDMKDSWLDMLWGKPTPAVLSLHDFLQCLCMFGGACGDVLLPRTIIG
jgi:hypothetical protein